jgi:histidyl-tRNA synthetase
MRLLINSMGDEACRPAYREEVRAFILSHATELCEECVRRADTNPLRAFDCKNEACRQVLVHAPKITDMLCGECPAHYSTVKSLLDEAGVGYEEEPRLVRGLDYYTRTVFEVQVDAGLGSQNAIGGGGRYDGLIQEFGGKPTPGLGFAVGLERVQLVLDALGTATNAPVTPTAYLAAVDDTMRSTAFSLAQRLRDAGITAEMDLQGRSLKSQFKQADRSGAAVVVIVGPDELASGSVRLRAMDTHGEQTVALEDVVDAVAAWAQ